MTATNHMLAGAVLAAAVQQPLAVGLLALASHAALDSLPHFGVHEENTAERNRHPLFRTVLAADLLLVLMALVFLPSLLKGVVSPRVVLAGMLLAWIPDSVWVYQFFHERRGGVFTAGRVAQFHQNLQRFERPAGLAVEALTLTGFGLALWRLGA